MGDLDQAIERNQNASAYNTATIRTISSTSSNGEWNDRLRSWEHVLTIRNCFRGANSLTCGVKAWQDLAVAQDPRGSTKSPIDFPLAFHTLPAAFRRDMIANLTLNGN